MSTLTQAALLDARAEAEILDQIIDAMLDAQDELAAAEPSQWPEALRDACRARKWLHASHPAR